MKQFYILLFSILVLGIGAANAQYTDLLNFDSANGAYPQGSLTLVNGRLYGMTTDGGANNWGCIFSIDTNGSGYKDLWNFNYSDTTNGADPERGSLLNIGEKLYGMTTYGGTGVAGIIFSINADGSDFTIIHEFNETINGFPQGGLINSGNVLYGMTYQGDTSAGSIFSIHTDGTNYKTLFNFDGSNGGDPYGSLILCGEKLYGMTWYYQPFSYGCIFSIDTLGANYKVLQVFDDTNGAGPQGSLLYSSGVLYGMTPGEYQFSSGNIFSIDTNGSNFKNLHWFNDTDARYSLGSLTLLNGNLYGMATGGFHTGGCIFSIDTNGTEYTDLYKFPYKQSYPVGDLTISGNMLYGMLSEGDVKPHLGIVFSFKDTAIHLKYTDTTKASAYLKVYPNPNNGQFTIKSSVGALVKIYDVLGQKVYDASLNQPQGFNLIYLKRSSQRRLFITGFKS